MEYTKIKKINEYISKSINPMKTPNTIFEVYSVPSFSTEHPEYLRGDEIASNKAVVKKNDVLLCKINPRINRVWVVADESEYQNIASSEWIIIRNSDYNPEFLAWYFRNPKFKNLMISGVTGMGGSLMRAQPKNVAEYPVPILKREKQDEIVSILNKVARVIEFRKKEIQKLDELIKARFVEMFGDPIKNPKGWDVVKLSECLERIDNGKSFTCDSNAREGAFPAILKLSAATYGDYRPYENKALLDEKQFVESVEVHRGDLLFTRKNTPDLVGMAAYVFETPEKLMMPDLIFRLVTNERMTPIFLWQLINNREFRPVIQGISGGSAKSMSNISKERLKNIEVICPPISEQKKLEGVLVQVNKSKVVYQIIINKLTFLQKICYNNHKEQYHIPG